jgi:LacI family transcriptional regulator
MSRRISVRDVAAAAGVSIGTVSRVMNDSGYASQGVRLRVQQAATRLGYQPDLAARRLRSGRSDTIGYLLNHIGNPFLASHLGEVERLLQPEGYALLLGTSERQARDRELVRFFESRGVDGIIAYPPDDYDDWATSPFADTRVPTVMLDRETGLACDSVILDHHGGMRKVMDYLLSLGHRRIAFYTAGAGARSGREKLRGYRAALEHAGLPYDERLTFMTRSLLDSSREPMTRMLQLDAPPTAIVALGTQLLSGAIQVVREAGMEIPGDMSVVGIGTVETLELMHPPATILSYNFRQSASAAVRLLLERIEGTAGEEARTVVVPWDLMLGASTAAPRR